MRYQHLYRLRVARFDWNQRFGPPCTSERYCKTRGPSLDRELRLLSGYKNTSISSFWSKGGGGNNGHAWLDEHPLPIAKTRHLASVYAKTTSPSPAILLMNGQRSLNYWFKLKSTRFNLLSKKVFLFPSILT